MTRQHTSTELHTTATAAVAKTLYLAVALMGWLESGRALGLEHDTAAQVEAKLSGKSDTSG